MCEIYLASVIGVNIYVMRIQMECPAGHGIFKSPTRLLFNFANFLHQNEVSNTHTLFECRVF